MEITVNGQPKTVPEKLFASSLINDCCVRPELVICELNGAILDRGRWAVTQLNPLDTVELIALVGGG